MQATEDSSNLLAEGASRLNRDEPIKLVSTNLMANRGLPRDDKLFITGARKVLASWFAGPEKSTSSDGG
ncbi:hypothetical protein K9M78_01405 [Candidatus Bipolaricaulota bacterium]|nr:hypothetical protein [Candidatus Bipolaricaulota bacterium]